MPRRLVATVSAALALTGGLASCAAVSEEPLLVPVTQLRSGDCFSMDAAGMVATVDTRCSQPHHYEVTTTQESAHASGDDFPGVEELASEADAACAAHFTELGGTGHPELTVLQLVPSAESWEAGDRMLLCLVANADGTELTTQRFVDGVLG